MRDIKKSKQKRKQSPIKVNELLLNQMSHANNPLHQPVHHNHEFIGDPSYIDGKPVRRKIQILNMNQSNETLNMI